MSKIILIVGPTGTGKTTLSIELAKKYNAEIINADSVQVYKKIDIASAKVTEEEKEGIPHHLLDFKEVTEDKYTEIYDNIKSNILFLKDYYSKMYDEAFNEIYTSPSNYYFLLNYSLINNDLAFIENELDEWFNLVKETNKQRVCLVHNNLSLDHFVKGMDSYLLSWDKYTFDTPIIDIVNLYKNEYLTCDFSGILKEYLKNFKLSKDEEKLLFILLSLPDQIEKEANEFNNTCNVTLTIDYIKRTEKLIRPYYTEKKKEEN